jgi:hypothetical protein
MYCLVRTEGKELQINTEYDKEEDIQKSWLSNQFEITYTVNLPIFTHLENANLQLSEVSLSLTVEWHCCQCE